MKLSLGACSCAGILGEAILWLMGFWHNRPKEGLPKKSKGNQIGPNEPAGSKDLWIYLGHAAI